MAKNKAGGNSRKIGRNANKPWKKRYDSLSCRDRNRRLAQERHARHVAKAAKKWERREKKRKPMRGYARAIRRIGKQSVIQVAA